MLNPELANRILKYIASKPGHLFTNHEIADEMKERVTAIVDQVEEIKNQFPNWLIVRMATHNLIAGLTLYNGRDYDVEQFFRAGGFKEVEKKALEKIADDTRKAKIDEEHKIAATNQAKMAIRYYKLALALSSIAMLISIISYFKR